MQRSVPAGAVAARLWTLAAAAILSAPLVVAAAEPAAESIALFNGKDLTGWATEGSASWEVRERTLIGRQGAGGAAGELLSTAEYDNFELTVRFRMEWPGNSGVWYRYQSADKAFQADILEYKEPVAFTGSLYCTGKMFIARNTDPKLVRRDDWNTLKIRAQGDRQQIWLNDVQVADVRDGTSDRGRIGFQVHAGQEFAKMRILIKEVALRKL